MSAAANPGRWGFVEMMGHRREMGLVTEVTFAGASMVHIATPQEDGSFVERITSPASIYCLTFTTEEAVRARLFPPKLELPAANLHEFEANADGECYTCGEDISARGHLCTDSDCMPRPHERASDGCVDDPFGGF